MEERERGVGRLAGDERADTRPEAAAHAAAVPTSAEEAEFQRQMAVGRRGMRKHRNVLAALR